MEQNSNGIMVLAEVRGGAIHPVTREMVAWGRKLAGQFSRPVTCVIIGIDPDDPEDLIRYGADRVLSVNPGFTGNSPATPTAGLFVDVIREERPAIVIAPATTSGRTLMPIAAARLNTGLTADCTDLAIDPKDGLLLQTRPAIGGNVMATIKTPNTLPQMATVRPRSIRPLQPDSARRGQVLVKTYEMPDSWPEQLLSFIRDERKEINLEEAEIVVTGGKGMKTKENFALLEDLAAALGAGLGATRAAVEAGWAPFTRQVGLTGKTVAPKVYIAAGVSGKIQHLAGMITSETIIAVNEDPEAQMVKVADLAVIGDAPAVVEKLTKALIHLKNKRKGGA
ncbi:MAG: electron transfer flavoprotein subunit alpha/FixB family protein [Armatimonadetes bacterium]|nr:electron transfer flavoprotein subunit alpha/FixB family protein [Armatimonadota bacterium]